MKKGKKEYLIVALDALDGGGDAMVLSVARPLIHSITSY